VNNRQGGLALYLLGPPILKYNGTPLEIGRRKALALLIYLAVSGQSHSRDTLATLFWPQHGQSQARANLRRALADLNRVLGQGVLKAEGENLVLENKQVLWVDMEEFRKLVGSCSSHEHPAEAACPRCIPLLSEAAALYRSDFLVGFTLPDCREFDEWQFFQSEQLRGELSNVLQRLIVVLKTKGRYDQAITFTRRRLALDPLNEPAHRMLMKLYAGNDQQTAALRQYRECVRALEIELDATPDEETTELYHSIKDNRLLAVSERRDIVKEAVKEGETKPVVAGALDHEIRIVTVLQAGQCPSSDRRGDGSAEDQADKISQLSETFRRILVEHGAEVEPSFGDDTWALFGATTSHEDEAERAVRAGLEIQKKAQALGMDIAVGINTGAVYMAVKDGQPQRETTVLGPLATRTTQLRFRAKAGEILVGETTYRQTSGIFAYSSKSIELFGASDPVAVYQVEGLKTTERKTHGIEGLQASFIGRDEELEKLKACVGSLLHGSGQVVSIIGEAGIGKSRLVAELRAGLDSTRGEDNPSALWLEGRCQELGMTVSYWPFLEMLRSFLGWSLQDDHPTRAASIVAALREIQDRGDISEEQLEEIGPLLGNLLSVQFQNDWDARLKTADPNQLRHRTFQAVREFLAAVSKKQPLILVFEDLHWADALSLDLISLLMEEVSERSLLLLCVCRPVREHKSSNLGTLALHKCPECYTELRLKELTPKQSRELVESLLRIEHLSSSVRELILYKSQGNPFFLEEVVRSLIDSEAILREGEEWKTVKEVESMTVSENVQSVIQSRVDRLESDSKQTLQTAAVIGPLVRRKILGQIVPAEINLDSALRALEGCALIYEERTYPEREYSFKHILVQETVYQAIPKNKRSELHRQVAETTEALYAGDLNGFYEQLAYHYERSPSTEKAIEFLLKAGEKARRNYLNDEAIGYFQRALQRLDDSGLNKIRKDWTLEALKKQGKVYMVAGSAETIEEYFRQAIRKGKEMELAPRDLVYFYYGLTEGLELQGRYDEVHLLAKEGLDVVGDDEETLEVALLNECMSMSFDYYPSSQHKKEHLKYRLKNARFVHRLLYSDAELCGPYFGIASAYIALKEEKEARKWVDILERKASENQDLQALAHVLCYMGFEVDYLKGYLQQAIRDDQEALKMSLKTGDRVLESFCLGFIGWIYELMGDLQQAEEYGRRAVKSSLTSGYKAMIADTLRNISTVHFCRGMREKGEGFLRRALPIYREQAEPNARCIGLVPVANALLSLGEVGEAVELFQEALHVLKRPAVDPQVDEWRLYFHRALSGLEEGLNDSEAFRSFCQSFQRQHPESSDSPFRWWYLLPAEVKKSLRKAVDEKFIGPLSAEWSWEDPFSDCSCQLRRGLKIQAANGRNLWGLNLSAPRMLRSVAGDFAVQMICAPATKRKPVLGGLLLWKDRKNYLYLERGKFGRHEIALKGCLDNQDLIFGRGRLPADRVYLRLERLGDSVRSLCSGDGKEWFTLGQVEFPVDDPVQVGLFGIGWIDRTIYTGAYPEGAAVKFESFQIWK